ncbi:hypothetical protein E3E36_02060 [Thermococcus sp. M36]|nr:hypothetical protein [Thermococcus sp. M36]
MSLGRSLFKFLLFNLPRLLFQVAGLFRAVNRGKRHFKKALRSEGLPNELVEELMREFDPLEGVSLRDISGFSRRHVETGDRK